MSVVIRLPLEIVKSRTQIGAYGPDTTLRKSLRMVWRNEGFKGFWRGYGGTLARDVGQITARKRLRGWLTIEASKIPFTITQFPLYEYLRKVFSENYPSGDGQGPTAVHSAIAGSIGGGVASLVTQPVDVVRTRIMLEAKVSSYCFRVAPRRTKSQLRTEITLGPSAISTIHLNLSPDHKLIPDGRVIGVVQGNRPENWSRHGRWWNLSGTVRGRKNMGRNGRMSHRSRISGKAGVS